MQRGKGFTLVELMISISILGIIAAFALPSFSEMIEDNRNREAGRRLFGTLNYMRATAVSRQVTVSLCPSMDSSTCSGNWENGGIVFEDKDRNSTRSNDETLLRVIESMPEGSQLTRSPSNRNFIRYRPSGRISFIGNFSFCPADRDANSGWVIVVNLLGRPYYGKDSEADGDNIVENGSGENLDCDSS